MAQDTTGRGDGSGGRWRRWARYALGIVIETAAVLAISLGALLVMLIIKAIIK